MLDYRYKRHEIFSIQAVDLVMPTLEKLLEYLNQGLIIASRIEFSNLVKRIKNTQYDIISIVNIYK